MEKHEKNESFESNDSLSEKSVVMLQTSNSVLTKGKKNQIWKCIILIFLVIYYYS